MKAIYLKDRIIIMREPWVVLHIIPDLTLKNSKLPLFLTSLHELYKIKAERIHILRDPIRIEIEEQAKFNFRIHLTKQEINFFLAIPEKWENYTKQKLHSIWPNITIQHASWEPFFDYNQSHACTLHLRRHSMLSLDTNLKEQKPLTSIINTIMSMDESSQAMIDILAEPFSKNQWEYDATQAYESFQKGSLPKKFELSIKFASRTFLELLAMLFREAFSLLSEFILDPKHQKKDNKGESYDADARLLAVKGLSPFTKQKTHLPTFTTWIRIVAQSQNKDLSQFLCRSIAASFRDISGDNELEKRDIHRTRLRDFIHIIHRRNPHGILGISTDKLSTNELAQIVQLPEEPLIEEFSQITAVRKREVSLPEELFEGGIPFAYHTEKGEKRIVHIPTKDYSIFCLPHIVFGPQGSGKTTLMKNMAVGAIKNGYSVFLIDTADGEGIDGARDALPEDFPDDHIIDLDFGNVKYPIPINLTDVATFDNAGGDDELGRRIVANKLKDAIIHFIKNISAYGETGFTDRMEEIFGAAGKAVLRNPQNSMLEIALALASPAYLQKLLEQDDVKSNIQTYEILSRLYADHMRNTARPKIEPIISRINLLLNNEFSANLFLQRNKLDKDGTPLVNFRKWADGDTHPYFVGIRVPKDDFGADMTNRITAFLLQKWYLAILSRANIPVNKRKPCLIIWDEPHTAIDASGHILENMAVELRKYRGKAVFLAHGPRQFKAHWGALTTGGYMLSVFNTKEIHVYRDLANDLQPFTMEEIVRQLPERWWTITKLSTRSRTNSQAFLAEMLPPPKIVKDRSYRREECSRIYGTHYKEVEKDIFERRKILLVDDNEMVETPKRARLR